MAKKIYDIKPPKVARKIENTIKELASPTPVPKRIRRTTSTAKTVAPIPTIKASAPVQNNKIERERERVIFSKRNILVGSGILVLIVGIYFYNSLQKATIEISPVTTQVSLQPKILVDKSVTQIDLVKGLIPAQYVEVEKESQQDFPATGSSSTDSKATGSITIYNKVDPASPVTLLKGTHFLSDTGKYFITLDKVTIPAAKSKSTPGSITVKVQAESVGSDYNIGASKFSVPKLSGTAYYYGIYAESSSKMIGGSTGKVKKVTKDDIQEAKDTLTKSLFDDADNSLRSSLSENDILLQGATSKVVIESISSEEAGSVADNFNQSVKIKVSALVFKRDDLEKFAKDYILSKSEDDQTLLEESLKIDYTSDIIDLEKGTESVNLSLSAKTYYAIESNELVELIRTKSPSEIEGIINEKYADNISEVKVNLWPFWVTKAPNNNNKIKIKLNFE